GQDRPTVLRGLLGRTQRYLWPPQYAPQLHQHNQSELPRPNGAQGSARLSGEPADRGGQCRRRSHHPSTTLPLRRVSSQKPTDYGLRTMQEIITGKAYVLGHNVDTDQIIPAQYLTFNPAIPEEYRQFGKYALSSVPPAQAGLPKGHIPFH